MRNADVEHLLENCRLRSEPAFRSSSQRERGRMLLELSAPDSTHHDKLVDPA